MKPSTNRLWKRVDDLFNVAVNLPPSERAPFLERACAGTPGLRLEVESLIERDGQAGGIFDQPAFFRDAAEQIAAQRADEPAAGRAIGPYRILRELARGGMGTVYLAERANGEFRQKVALKVIKRGMDTDSIIERFQRERQILADLDHPNIARLLDGGSTEDGCPYLVLELIEGEPIHRYCDRHRLSIDERLELFLQVCSAVQYAHQNLIVHRDLKPSNILVTEEGIPKLLDFGTAKLLEPALGGTLTVTGLRLLTPGYASPEQLRGGTITTASDVYGLGALLYELLTGRRTHRLTSRHPTELVRVICEELPETPSAVVARTDLAGDGQEGATPEEVAMARDTQPARIRRQLRGDLDRIVLMALRKEPERRYPSVQLLSQDLRWHLEGRPVQARADSLAYRASKLLRRNRKIVAGVALFLGLVLGFAFAMARLSVETGRERDRARFERDKSLQVSTFLVDLLANAAPGDQEEQALTTRHLIDRGVSRIRREYVHRPVIQASLLEALGKSLREMGLVEKAELLLEDALAIRTDLLGPEHLDTATSLHELGVLYAEQGRQGEAERSLERGLAIREAALGPDHPEVATSLAGLSDLWVTMGEYDRSAKLTERALEIRRQTLGPDHPETAFSLHDLGLIVFLQGDLNRAVELMEQALEIRRHTLGPAHPETADSLHNLGHVHYTAGRARLAEPLVVRALEIYEEAFGPEHPHVAAAADSRARMRMFFDDFEAAEPYYRRALEVRRNAYGPNHYEVGVSFHNLGYLLFRSGGYEQAEPLLREAVRIEEATLGPEHPFVAVSLHYLGLIARQRGDLAAAESSLTRAIEIRSNALGANHAEVAKSLNGLALVHQDRGELAEAASLLHRARTIREKELGAEHPDLAATLHDLARLEIDRRQSEDAIRYAERALAIRRQALGKEHPATLETQELLASLVR